VLLIERDREPFAGCWALPGGFIDIGEPLEAAARRELAEETGLTVPQLRQFRAYGDPGRDPRGRTVAVVFYGFCPWRKRRVQGGDDARRAQWFPWDDTPPLAFDHSQILTDFRHFLRLQAQVVPLGRELLGQSFAWSDLAHLYKAILSDGAVASALVRRLRRGGIVIPCPRGGSGKITVQAKYRFNLRFYQAYERVGLVGGRPVLPQTKMEED
jgi:8-oxo-dGTP diphosphatase